MLSRKAILCVILLFASTLVTIATAQTAVAQQKGNPAPEKVIAIHAANLIDGISNQVRHNVLVVIKGNKIESVTSGGNPPAGATVINLPADVTVLPGLIDTHTHIFLQGEDPKVESYDEQLLKHPSSYRAARAAVSAQRALEQGFTTLRDLETEG
ncbi:MAG: amidohydrolase family protein, partial [Candidatus Angelobacter sp.]